MKDQDLAGLVSARICHDLANPIGAIVNGTDLINELEDGQIGDELAMVAQSAERAAAIVKFHRLAFGSSGGSQTRISHRDLHGRIAPVLHGPRLTFEWEPEPDGDISVPCARLACLMLLIARAVLTRGGVMTLQTRGANGLPLLVQATGPQIRPSDDQRELLNGIQGAQVQSREVEFALVGLAAQGVNARIELSETPDRLNLDALPR